MMNVSFEVIASVALVTGLVALLVAYLQGSRVKALLAHQQDLLHAMQADVGTVCAGAVNLGEHMAHLEQKTHLLTQRQDQLDMKEPATQSYRQASKMIHKGAQLEEVMEDCGLARGEAELIALAQRIKKAS